MSNSNIDDLKKKKKQGDGLVLSAFAALIGGASVALCKSASDNAERTRLNQRKIDLESAINKINIQISKYKDEFMGGWLHSDEISSLEKKRSEYQAELNEIKRKLS